MTDERPLTVAQAVAYYPRGTHKSTVLRHITRGVVTPRGVVRLEASRIGKRWTITPEAIERFRAACTNSYIDAPPPAASRAKANAKANAKAKAALKAMGWLR